MRRIEKGGLSRLGGLVAQQFQGIMTEIGDLTDTRFGVIKGETSTIPLDVILPDAELLLLAKTGQSCQQRHQDMLTELHR